MSRIGPRIARAGAWAATGTSPVQVAMLARASKLSPRDVPFADRDGEPIGCAVACGLPDHLVGYDRAFEMAAAALSQLGLGGRTLPLILALPEEGRPGDDARYDGAILAGLADESEIRLDVARSGVIRQGRAGGAAAIEKGLAAMVDPAVEAVVIGAVDTHFHPDTFAWLDEEHRLLGPENDDGFIPGEGAAFLVLSASTAWVTPKSTRVLFARTAIESSVGDGTPNLATAGTGLVLAATALRPPGWVFTDLNGERDRTAEWMTIQYRASLGRPIERVDGSQWFGDAGAAAGLLAVASIDALFAAGAAPATTSLVSLASDGPLRGAMLLEMGQ